MTTPPVTALADLIGGVIHDAHGDAHIITDLGRVYCTQFGARVRFEPRGGVVVTLGSMHDDPLLLARAYFAAAHGCGGACVELVGLEVRS